MSFTNKSNHIIPTVFSIAGSDPCGGAGIQADLKTMTALGVYAAAAITCITVQNSLGVSRVEPLPADLVREQIQAVLDDHFVTHIKIGMVGTKILAETIKETLTEFNGEVIYDPVMFATTGQKLTEAPDTSSAPAGLLDVTTVLTPNLPELAMLSGKKITSDLEAREAGRFLLTTLPRLRAIVIKGGHLHNSVDITDYFMVKTTQGVEVFSETHPRIPSNNTHGTGCTLASAFAACHCRTGDYIAAFRGSVHYIQQTLARGSGKKIIMNANGHGPMLHT